MKKIHLIAAALAVAGTVFGSAPLTDDAPKPNYGFGNETAIRSVEELAGAVGATVTPETPYLVIALDEKCRRQQLGEGWFPKLEDVPERAISMSVRQILKSRAIINTVPDLRKAEAVRDALEGELTNRCPASILRTHADVTTFLDRDSASLLEKKYE